MKVIILYIVFFKVSYLTMLLSSRLYSVDLHGYAKYVYLQNKIIMCHFSWTYNYQIIIRLDRQ
jgi:hypothetical protein